MNALEPAERNYLTAPRHSERFYYLRALADTDYRGHRRRMKTNMACATISSEEHATIRALDYYPYGKCWANTSLHQRAANRPNVWIGIYLEHYAKAWPAAEYLAKVKEACILTRTRGNPCAMLSLGLKFANPTTEQFSDKVFTRGIDGYEYNPLRAFHDVQPSKEDPTKVSFYESHAKRLAKRRTVMAPGRYLERYYGAAAPIPNTQLQVRDAAAAWIMAHRPVQLHFKENTDPDGWTWVYEMNEGFSSCMGMGEHSGNGPVAVRAYARPGNGLRLAYITKDGAADDRVVARAIVREDAERGIKGRARVYGDDRLNAVLDEHGYPSTVKLLDGVEMEAIPTARGAPVFYTPYVDAGAASGGGSLYLDLRHKDGQSYLVANDDGDGVYTGDRYAQAWTDFDCFDSDDEDDDRSNTFDCNNCGDETDDDDCESTFRDGYICSHCASHHYVAAYVSRRRQELVRYDDTTETPDGDHVDTYEGDDLLRELGFVRCGDDDELVRASECVNAEPDGALYHPDDVVEIDEPGLNGLTVCLKNAVVRELFTGRRLSPDLFASSQMYTRHSERAGFPEPLPDDWMQRMQVTAWKPYAEFSSVWFDFGDAPTGLAPFAEIVWVMSLEEALMQGTLRGQSVPSAIRRRIPEHLLHHIDGAPAADPYTLAA